ncbi:MAG: hypothetical protein HY659_02445 [Rhizobiales bacterium]|nr:hypothetical protein [Hyphomicrobiales bacterium]
MYRRFLSAALLASILCAGPAQAQDAPPLDLLKAILRKLEGRPVPTGILFRPAAAAQTDDVCRMQPFDMVLTRSDNPVRSYSVLLDRQQHGAAPAPRQMLAMLTRVTVDADGSPRAYHPEDPEGAGTCQRLRGPDGSEILQGVCALDQFASGQTHLFRGADKLGKQELLREWKDLWPLIRDRKLKSFDLETLAGPGVPKGYYLFHWRERNLTAFFKSYIIPKSKDGYPCVHGPESPFAGYFVAATTLNHNAPVRADGCAPARYIDAEKIPFFVLPKGGFGQVGIGDVMIARLKHNGADRVVYGLVADAGPPHQLGEGSVALNAALLGKDGAPVLNMRDTWALDISGPAVAVLVLGGTKHLLKGDYSRRNVEAVAKSEFARWNADQGNPLRRLDACMAQAKVNAKKH